MKTTVDIPDTILTEAMRHTRATTKREPIVTAMEDYNRRRRMAKVLRHAGTCGELVKPEELQQLRRKR